MSEQSTVVVTGGNRGIGRAVADLAAANGHRVVVVSRGGPVDGFEHVPGDLGSIRTTRAAADAIAAVCPRVDVLVHNAGVWPSRLERNEDGFEQAYCTNHLAPFLLNHLLEERLGRVVQVSAGLYVKGAVDPERTPGGDDFHPIRTYANSKLANVLMLPLWAERWRGAGRSIDAVHPGVIRTGLGDRGGPLGLLLKAVKLTWRRPEEGARNVVRLLEDTGGTGRYFDEAREVPVAHDAALARRLWDDAVRALDVA